MTPKTVEELKEVYEFLKSKGFPVAWQDEEPCIRIPVYTYSQLDGEKCQNQVCFFEGSTCWQLDDYAWEDIYEE